MANWPWELFQDRPTHYKLHEMLRNLTTRSSDLKSSDVQKPTLDSVNGAFVLKYIYLTQHLTESTNYWHQYFSFI